LTGEKKEKFPLLREKCVAHGDTERRTKKYDLFSKPRREEGKERGEHTLSERTAPTREVNLPPYNVSTLKSSSPGQKGGGEEDQSKSGAGVFLKC